VNISKMVPFRSLKMFSVNRGRLRAEGSLCSLILRGERFPASLGMAIQRTIAASKRP
jgi:hypothetical protein